MRGKSVALWVGILAGLALFVFFAFQTTVTRGVDVGEPVDELGLTTIEGAPFPLAQWRGTGVVLRFSSSTCTSCPQDYALLQQWQEELGERVQVAAVQVGDTATTVRASLMGSSARVPILLDTQGEAARRLGLKQVPAVYFITARGTLSSVSNVEVARTDVRTHVRQMLAGGPTIDTDVRRVSEQLQCQECQGRSAWDSDSRSSYELREQVRGRLVEGERPKEVVRGIAEEYGEWILMAPPVHGVASLAWLLPLGVTLVGGGAWAILLRRARRRLPRPDETAEEEQAVEERRERLARRIDEYM